MCSISVPRRNVRSSYSLNIRSSEDDKDSVDLIGYRREESDVEVAARPDEVQERESPTEERVDIDRFSS